MEKTVTKPAGAIGLGGWQAFAPLLGLLLLAALAVWMIASQFAPAPNGGPGANEIGRAQAAFEEAVGIRLVRVALTAGGGMLDLRYQVVDPDKALIVHDEEDPPTLIDEATGVAVRTPWHDHSTDFVHTGVHYYELIMNPDGVIRRGNTVTLVIGDARLEGIVVQ